MPLEFEQKRRRHIGDNAATIPTCLRQVGDRSAISWRLFIFVNTRRTATNFSFFMKISRRSWPQSCHSPQSRRGRRQVGKRQEWCRICLRHRMTCIFVNIREQIRGKIRQCNEPFTWEDCTGSGIRAWIRRSARRENDIKCRYHTTNDIKRDGLSHARRAEVA